MVSKALRSHADSRDHEKESDERRVVLKVTVEVSDDASDAILVREGDTAPALAERFCRKHGLRECLVAPLTAHIERNLQKAKFMERLRTVPTPLGLAERGRCRSSSGSGGGRSGGAAHGTGPSREGDISERLYRDAAERESKKKVLQTKYAEMRRQVEDHELTFSPAIGASQRTCHGFGRTKQDPHGLKTKKKIEDMRELKERTELHGCTFKPEVDQRSDKLMNQRLARLKITGSLYDALYEDALRRKERFQETKGSAATWPTEAANTSSATSSNHAEGVGELPCRSELEAIRQDWFGRGLQGSCCRSSSEERLPSGGSGGRRPLQRTCEQPTRSRSQHSLAGDEAAGAVPVQEAMHISRKPSVPRGLAAAAASQLSGAVATPRERADACTAPLRAAAAASSAAQPGGAPAGAQGSFAECGAAAARVIDLTAP